MWNPPIWMSRDVKLEGCGLPSVIKGQGLPPFERVGCSQLDLNLNFFVQEIVAIDFAGDHWWGKLQGGKRVEHVDVRIRGDEC